MLNFLKQAGLDGRDAFWSERVVGTARQLVVDMRNDDPRQFTVELRRTFNTRSLPAGAALRLRMPLPLTSDHLGDIEVHPHAAAAAAHVAVGRGAEAWIDGQGWMPFDFSCWELSRGGEDPAWRDYFFGRIDCRLTNQCLPLDFTGAVGVKIPAAWHIQQSAQPVGVAVGLFDVEGKLVCCDFVAVVGQKDLCKFPEREDLAVAAEHSSTIEYSLGQRGDVVAKCLTHGLKAAVNHNNQSFLREGLCFLREGLSAEVVATSLGHVGGPGSGKVTIRQSIEVPLLPVQH